MFPILGLIDQREGTAQAAAEDKRINRHTSRVIPGRIKARAIYSGNRKARIRMCCQTPAIRGPVIALPINQMSRGVAVFAFPPDIAVIGQRDIGEDRILLDHRHGIRVRLGRRPRHHTEVTGFRIDRVKLPVITRFDPGNVVTNCADGPAFITLGRNKHRQIGLATCTWESRSDIGLLTLRGCQAKDQHMFSQPAFFLRHNRGNSQGEALLAE